MIKTDHHNLKYLLEKKITTPSKLLGYDYTISYKKGKGNIVADALSRKEEAIQLFSIFGISSDLLESVKLRWNQDPHLQNLIQNI